MLNKNRGWQRVLLIIIPYLFVEGIFQIIGMLLVNVDFNNLNSQRTIQQDLIIHFFDLLGTLLIIWIFMKYIDEENFINIGFKRRNKFHEFIVGVGIGALIMGGGYFLLWAIDEIEFYHIIYFPEKLIKSTFLFLIVALAEETFMRGYVLRNLMISFNKYIALFISSLLFSFMHTLNPYIDYIGFINIFFAGLVLGGAYVHTRNLWFPIGLHLGWNLFQTHFGFNVSGQDSYSLVEFNISESNLLNGGAFGFEGSVLSIIAQIALFFIIVYYYERKKLTSTTPPSRKHANRIMKNYHTSF